MKPHIQTQQQLYANFLFLYDRYIFETDDYKDCVTIMLTKPDIEDQVEQNTVDIEIANGAIAELAEIIGGGE